MISNIFYELPQKSWWQGRIDGQEANFLRMHQHVQIMELNALRPRSGSQSVIFLGFASDEGVKRNQGRSGSVAGPYYLRKACSQLPVHYSDQLQLFDTGNIATINGNLALASEYVAQAVALIIENQGFPVLLGGGHEIVSGHYRGLKEKMPDKKIGIVNIDAHFDLRPVSNAGPTSGTSFYEIFEDCRQRDQSFHYLAIGIQRSANTRQLFEEARRTGTSYIPAEMIHDQNISAITQKIQSFADQVDHLYLSIDLDVFNSSIAPGVSSPTATGLFYDHHFRTMLSACFATKKIISMDIAELNPTYDIDNRTAKLGAQIIFDSLLALEDNLSL